MKPAGRKQSTRRRSAPQGGIRAAGAGGPLPPGVAALTKAQMAAALQISVRSLNGMMARGEISYFKIGPRLVRFRIEDAVKRMNETVLVGGVPGEQLRQS